MKKRIVLFILMVLMSAGVAAAHQPEYVKDSKAIEDNSPEISRAYYGEIKGAPAVYTVQNSKDFDLYVNILAPDIAGAKTDFSVEIKEGDRQIAHLAPGSAWEVWHEEFAGDDYLKGPEFKKAVPAGTYTITVSNPGDTGKYVLAIGETESFPASKLVSTISSIYAIKTGFFGKPWYSIFQGIIGRTLLVSALVIIAIIIVLILLWLRRRARSI